VKSAHNDFVRTLSAHPTENMILSGSDDFSIRLWTFDDKGKLSLKKEFIEHTNFVMMVKFNPKEPVYFASASTDTTVKIWSLNKTNSNITLKGHVSGVNGISFSTGEESYLASASDDKTVKIWDT
jgi:WD40 repeat protein